MALLYDARLRAIDSDGNLLVGATLTINTANTSSPAAIYRNAALSTPMTNPTSGEDVSDAGGWFPQIFAAEGTVVDITLKDSSGNIVSTEVDVTFLGADDTGELSRVMADDTRFKVRGSGGVVYMEFGDPDPDNIGGTAVIGGWAGTQADLITVNAALFNVVGRIKENGKKINGTVYTEGSFTTASTVDIALPQDPTGSRAWSLEVFDLAQSVSANLRGRLSYDGAVSFKSGASDYDLGRVISGTNGITTGGGAAAFMEFTINSSTPANKPAWMRVELITPNSGNDATVLRSTANAYDNTGTPKADVFNATNFGLGNFGRATHLRIFPASGTITGKYRLTALRGFGET